MVRAFGLWRGHQEMEAGKDTKRFEREGPGVGVRVRRLVRGVGAKIKNHGDTEGTEESDRNGFGDGRVVRAFGLRHGRERMEAGKDTKCSEGEGPGVGVRARRLVRGMGAEGSDYSA